MKFVNKRRIIKDNLFKTPALFKLIHEESDTNWKEMYEVFNMGHRLEIYLPEKYAKDVIKISESYSIDAKIIGRVEASANNELIINSENGVFKY